MTPAGVSQTGCRRRRRAAARPRVTRLSVAAQEHRVESVPRQLFVFDPPERFVAGTVGQPGERTFYLQASGAGRIVSVALEKVQVAILAERLDELLDEVRRRQGDASDVPAQTPNELEDVAPL